MRIAFAVCVVCAAAWSGWAADPVVSNVRAVQRAGTKMVDIAYDVTDPDGNGVNVGVAVSTNAGATYDLKAVSFSGGGYGGVSAGAGKTIVWDAGLDWGGNYSEQMRVRVSAESLPPDPDEAAPEPTAGVATLMPLSAQFLYTGANPVQTGVDTNLMDMARLSVLTGRTVNESGEPLAGIAVSVEGGAEFGRTMTRLDGRFDMAVNGGGPLSVNFSNAAYLAVQRTIEVPWQDYVVLDDVTMKQADTNVTRLALAGRSARRSETEMLVARGGVVSDADGTRRAVVMLPTDVEAMIVTASGQTQAIDTLTTRFTEFTVGTNGPAAMPGDLPPTVAYTYAVELGATEARAKVAGKDVMFNTNVYFYVDNFLGFPAGTPVPSAYYDETAEAWIPAQNGVVIDLLGTNTHGQAYVDADGDGEPDDPFALEALGFTAAELLQLGREYSPTQSLWRAPITHFSRCDLNFPVAPEPDVHPPSGDDTDADVPGAHDDVNPPVTDSGWGTVELDNQVFRESLPLAGTPFTLNYSSYGSEGFLAGNAAEIKLTSGNPPEKLKAVKLTVCVAGRTFDYEFEPAPNLEYRFEWNGLNVYGRRMHGAHKATIVIRYVYDAYYQIPPERAASFGLPSGQPGQIKARKPAVFSTIYEVMLMSSSKPVVSQQIGGWSLSAHHIYDANKKMLYMGDGRRHDGGVLRAAMEVKGARERFGLVKPVAGTGTAGYSGDGGAATNAQLNAPSGMCVGPDGSLYVADTSNNCVRRIGIDGVITTVAGTGTAGWSGDGGAAVTAQLRAPRGVYVTGDGVLFIADSGNYRVRRVGSDGAIGTVAGNGLPGHPVGVDDESAAATDAYIGSVNGVAVAGDGTMWLACGDICRIRRVGPDGRIFTAAGTGAAGYSGDNGPATNASIGVVGGINLGPDGGVYFSNGAVHPAIRRIGTDGAISTVAGKGVQGYSGNNGPATNAAFHSALDVAARADGALLIADDQNRCVRTVAQDGTVVLSSGRGSLLNNGADYVGPALDSTMGKARGIAVAPDNVYYIADTEQHHIRRVEPVMASATYILRHDTINLIASPDGAHVYELDKWGRHTRTLDAITGAAVYEFGYNSDSLLTSITDGDGNVTAIQRDSSGNATAIVSPYNQETALGMDSSGYLSSFTAPDGQTFAFAYTNGLLRLVRGPRGGDYTAVYDATGRVTRVSDPAGGFTKYARNTATNGFDVCSTTAVGAVKSVSQREMSSGGKRRVLTHPDGTQTVSVTAPDGTETNIAPDGTVTVTKYRADPRFGMQSPFAGSVVTRLPSGLVSSTTVERVVRLIGASPFNILSITNTTVHNQKTGTWGYNGPTRTVTAVTPAGRQTTTRLDSQFRPVSIQAQGFAILTNTFDARGRLTNTTRGTGADARSTLYFYNSTGQVERTVDSFGRTNRFARDAAGRMLSWTLPDNGQITFSYDAHGNMTSIAPPGRPAHSFTYNAVDLPSSYSPPAAGGQTNRVTYSYNADRQLTQVSRPDGKTVNYVYDSAGRLRRINLNGGGIGYGYDTRGRLAAATSAVGQAVSYSYDGPLVTQERWKGPVTGAVSYTYNNDFQTASRRVNGGNQVNYGYDADGLPTNAGACSLQRDAQNGLLTGVALSGVTEVFACNEFAELTNYASVFQGSNVFSLTSQYDKYGTLTNKIEIVGHDDAVTNAFDYSYDAAGRLIGVRTNGVAAAEYQYDANGNRTNWTLNGAGFFAVYDDEDRLSVFTAGTNQYSAYGDLTDKTVNGAATSYEYDELGNLLSVALPGGANISYIIDGRNRRVGKVKDGVFERGFLYSGALNPVAEIDSSSNLVSVFVYGSRLNTPDYMVKNGVTYRFVCDQLGSPRLIVDADTGAIAQRLDYDEFGRALTNSAPDFQPFGFAGGLYDADTGLVRFGARDYDAEFGRWLSKDPIKFSGGNANLYCYVNNNPVNMCDRLGLGPTVVSNPFPNQSGTIMSAAPVEDLMRQREKSRLPPDTQNQLNDLHDLIMAYHDQVKNGMTVAGLDDPFLAEINSRAGELDGHLNLLPEYDQQFIDNLRKGNAIKQLNETISGLAEGAGGMGP